MAATASTTSTESSNVSSLGIPYTETFIVDELSEAFEANAANLISLGDTGLIKSCGAIMLKDSSLDHCMFMDERLAFGDVAWKDAPDTKKRVVDFTKEVDIHAISALASNCWIVNGKEFFKKALQIHAESGRSWAIDKRVKQEAKRLFRLFVTLNKTEKFSEIIQDVIEAAAGLDTENEDVCLALCLLI